ncbi:hypothetical protein AMB3_3505 [plant metagenome]|uniref:Methyltransferase domain-containing protein n=1 Tax=plant metagenome TaxID=1297885 RepID=A0A484PHT8_9ZZZZ
MRTLKTAASALLIASCAFGAPALAQIKLSDALPYSPMVGQEGKDVIWVPTPQPLVDLMLDTAKLTPADKLVDLGSGDGRLVITAAKRGASARGIEYNPDLVGLARRQAAAQGVGDKAVFEEADIFESDFSEANVVTLFLLPALNLRLRPTLLDMAPGTRIVANSFTMDDWKPDEIAQLAGEACEGWCTAYKWVVPAKVEGVWQLGDDKVLTLKQEFQMLTGTLRDRGVSAPIRDARLYGDEIRYAVYGDTYVGRVKGSQMAGLRNDTEAWQAKAAAR